MNRIAKGLAAAVIALAVGMGSAAAQTPIIASSSART